MIRIIEPTRLTAHDLDDLPLLTFLVKGVPARTDDGPIIRPMRAMRLVKPRDRTPYPETHLTPADRLLYWFWQEHPAGGMAVKKLASAITRNWHWIVMPGEKGFELLDAFKIACDHRRGKPMKPDLLCRALGLETPVS